ncbi:hypothetical protein ES703_109769 [subsurface metagenome]
MLGLISIAFLVSFTTEGLFGNSVLKRISGLLVGRLATRGACFSTDSLRLITSRSLVPIPGGLFCKPTIVPVSSLLSAPLLKLGSPLIINAIINIKTKPNSNPILASEVINKTPFSLFTFYFLPQSRIFFLSFPRKRESIFFDFLFSFSALSAFSAVNLPFLIFFVRFLVLRFLLAGFWRLPLASVQPAFS